MRTIKIQIKPFEMISILNYDEVQEMNEHGLAKISGLIPFEKKDEYIKTAMKETWVKILGYEEKGDEKTLFYGVLTEFNIRTEGKSCILDLTLYSGSRLMDYDRHTRSFQKDGYTYKKIAECCNEEYPETGMIMTEGRNEAVQGFIMQYDETDWEFLKRIAGYLNTVLVPSCQVNGEKYFFGIPDKKADGSLNMESYVLHQGREVYLSGKAEGAKISRKENVSYIADSREVYALGDQISFNEETLYIWRMERSKKGEELWHRYYLKKKQALRVPTVYNRKLTGLSLLGRVESVKGEQVKITLEHDENTGSGNRWFAYSTVYSSPEGAGWYCMPEIGDSVRLYFPTEDEKEAYVSSAFHENQGGGLRTDPSHKIWRNKEGKEIRLTPDKVLITNNKGMSVELSDQSGIKIRSNASVTIDADNDISISSSSANLELAAANKITLTQGESRLELSDGIRLSGAVIKMQ